MEQREIDKLVRENQSMRFCLGLIKDYAFRAIWGGWRHDIAMLAMRGLNLNGKGELR